MPPESFRRLSLFMNGIVLIALLWHSISRDIRLEKQYPFDLRNRVVGARLQKDGRSPYFYKWKSGDGFRYMDPKNGSPLSVSNITASPFLHDLFIPFCDLPQRNLSIFWLGFQYLILILITVLFTLLTEDSYKKIALVNLSVLFTCTEAWKSLVETGQIYFLNALLMTCIVYGLLKSKKPLYTFGAAFFAALFVLIRPIAIMIFLPFLLRRWDSWKFLVVSGSVILIYSLFAVLDPNERQYWEDYRSSLKENIKLHLSGHPTIQKNQRLPTIHKLEDFDFDQAVRISNSDPITVYSENGNAFVLYQQLVGKKPGLGLLTGTFFFLSALLISGFFILYWKRKVPNSHLILFGLSLYMLAEIFSPIHRHQYYTVQWLPLLLLDIILIKNWKEPSFFLLLAGLFLNIGNLPFIPMRHSVGECVWIVALMMTVFKRPVYETLPSTQ